MTPLKETAPLIVNSDPRKKVSAHIDNPSRLQSELRQTKSFDSVQAEAFLNLVRTTEQMQHALRLKLTPYGITETQYNLLRILRGAGATGLTCAEIGERLVSRDPDITRLLGRLERQGLVRRERGAKDRRVIVTKIAVAGLAKLKETDSVVDSTVNSLLARLSQAELRKMIDLLERARPPAALFGGKKRANESRGERGPD